MKPRMKNLTRYECPAKGCGKLWALHPEFIVISGRSPIFCGYDRNGRKKFRREAHCDCGEVFHYPTRFAENYRGE